MKLLGIIGGMSWTSTAEYYRRLNEAVARERGGLSSARLLLHSVDFAEIEVLQKSGEWEEAGRQLADVARGLERAGAEGLLIATNTMHKVASQVEAACDLPLLHIADATGAAIRAAGLRKIGLLATAFTMEQDFYRGRLAQKYGLDVLVPDAPDRAEVHRIIYDQLCRGVVTDGSRDIYRRIMADLVGRGAEGVILGCTEITLLVNQNDSSVPLFDTTAIHVEAATDFLLG
ncbi:aspartate/glutamate racemase [Deinococcus irradiatisoli]|uniref:Aspartate/glutamate racemase n=1 Tax=Deinococcus irradiatisoli TaxID=2202254 RepID=A0A2Z3JJX5_9DEIO|nr:aspartate/glutamate racemase family protein [Deinococcus irradiatisoli]AWN23209.1 aspartate/glutamate racemase [Deinococcus irradiatisoli]